ncbi:4-hydroxy-tetrahydrodipicolinate synthase [Aquibaculum arenosum]|uniref:4-hydroxy-tetrahydrodipicolinate synthase n=1 Tax=Aquibaculum arenosum TaxID=3032591 RepID=A0ABT5YK33_9PROT|nr:4-hydroxy-tetrahydrodipicolinate synthase [Fodinicurvata sp. CAU 1616]MDF2095293.1 4-hydroxy-tetrahydrodipicolinate synthase [Fodinicurvata sp. CAU 1616]
MTGPLFTGSLTALITPFVDNRVDEQGFRDFVKWQIDEGTDALVPVGTTGESPTLSHDEHKRVVELCIEAAAGRAPVIAGAGSNSTAEAIDFMQHAEKAGADAALVVTPYYNKPNQEGLYQHFKAIHDASSLPILIYNIPGRSIVDMSVETMARLAELPRIAGVKDATADLVRPALTRAAIGKDFCQLSGEDATILPYMAQGGHGCISVTANVAPRLCAEFHTAWKRGDIAAAQEINDRLMPLHTTLFIEPSPQPVKYALSLLGHCRNELRLPLVQVTPETQKRVRDAMIHAGLLN